MRVISYNLRKHRAATELVELVVAHDPDILCLQEVDTTDLPETVEGLSLISSTKGALRR
mgnify:FL=1